MSPDTYIAGLSAHFSAGRYDQMTPRFCFPVPVFVNDKSAILANPQQMWGFFECLHSRFLAAGLPQLKGKLASVELPRGGKFRMWIDWIAIGPDGAELAMQTLSYNRGTHSDCMIEMFQITTDKAIADEAWQDAA